MTTSQDQELEMCMSSHSNKTHDTNQSRLAQGFCPTAWDGFNCWDGIAGKLVFRVCPSVKGSDSNYMAFRKCGGMGKWLNKEGEPSDIGWTNYTPCFTPEIAEIMKRLGSQHEAQTKLNIAVNTRILELVGLALSLTALIISLMIFYKFRTLRNSRTRLHRHLFIAMVMQVAIRLSIYLDQAITRESGGDSSRKFLNQAEESLRGIDNTPILCEASYVMLEYFRTCMFCWFGLEGMYLFNMVSVTVFEEKLSPATYFIVGWVLPIPLTVAWTIVTAFNYESATCWWGYPFTSYFWILEGPRLGILLVNFGFLLNILRVLVTKLRKSNSSEIDQVRKAVKAALLLLPLLGLTNMLHMVHAPLEKSAWVFGIWSYSTHLLTSCQGLILSFLYCFNNGEVQIVVKKYVRIKILGRNKIIRNPRNSAKISLLNHTVVAAQIENGERLVTNPGFCCDIRSVPIQIQPDQQKFNHSINGLSNSKGTNLNKLELSENNSPECSIKMLRNASELGFLFHKRKEEVHKGLKYTNDTKTGKSQCPENASTESNEDGCKENPKTGNDFDTLENNPI